MLVMKSSCIVALGLLCTLPALFSLNFTIPIMIRALKPYGVMISVPDTPTMDYITFKGLVGDNDYSNPINIAVGKPVNGFWTGKDHGVVLRVGDVINYTTRAVFNKKGGVRETLSVGSWYTVTELYPYNDFFSTCENTPTDVKYKKGELDYYCAGQIIFEDDFDNLREDIWTVENYMPAAPEYPFVSYQHQTVSAKDSYLGIEPQLLQSLLGFNQDSILTGELDLTKTGCTREEKYCIFRSIGPQILPPIISGRISSAAHFAFKYGVVQVRAKVPQGDWLYPDILHEPISKSFCTEHQRVLRIAGVRGNLLLSDGTEEYGNKLLYGGPLMDVKCRNNSLAKKISATEWGNEFHVYSMRWSPDMITLFVDDEEWGSMNLPASQTCGSLLNQETCVSPFNDFFGITLGVSAGGILEFPDGVISGETPKPWRNMEHKARLKFYQAIDTWLPTWTWKSLRVDYVRVLALIN